MLYFFDLTDMRPGLPTMPGSPPPPVGPCGNGPRMPNPQQPNMAFGNSNDFRPNPPGVMSTGTDMLRKQLEQNQPSIKSPMNSQMSHGAMGGPGSISGSSLLMQQLEKQPPCNPDPKVINQVAGTLANKVPTDNLHNLLPNQQQPSTSQEMKMEVKTEPDFKTEIKEEPMDSFSESSSANDLHPIKKEEIKHEPDIKKESTSDDAPSAAAASKSSATPESTAVSKLPLGANKVTFAPEELKKALEPPLMKLYNLEPEAIPFRVPVDPNALGIPDYFEIIKKPMDMASIKRKLDTGGYSDPWQYIDDIWQMFENAWTYNRKTSRVYKYCSKVSLSFFFF